MWLVKLPGSLLLSRPRYSLDRAPGISLVGEIVKARPWPPNLGFSGTIAKAKEVEKEKALPSVEFLNWIGFE